MKGPDEMPAPARAGHRHPGCGDIHGCFCFTPKTEECQSCRTRAFNARMARTYAEDRVSTEELLERRA